MRSCRSPEFDPAKGTRFADGQSVMFGPRACGGEGPGQPWAAIDGPAAGKELAVRVSDHEMPSPIGAPLARLAAAAGVPRVGYAAARQL